MTKQKKKVRKPRELKKHLWKIKHPYQMTYGCYFNNDCHEDYENFDEFLLEWDGADQDYNWVIRWDWNKANLEEGVEHDTLEVQFMIQRKAYPFSCAIRVTDKDEPRVKRFLARHAKYTKTMWEPLL